MPFVRKVPIVPFDIAKTSSSNPKDPTAWRPTNVSPQTVAVQVDAMIKSLKGVSADVDYNLMMQTGNARGSLQEKIQDKNTYSLMYPVITKNTKFGLEPRTARATANGTVSTERVLNQVTQKKVGTPTKGATGTDLAQNWPTLGNREVFAGLLDARNPFGDYVSALVDKRNGYDTKVVERTFPYNGEMIHQYMIQASRSGKAARTLGESAVSIVVDASIHLPVTMTVSVKKPGADREDYLGWNAIWKNHQKFDPTVFAPQTVSPIIK